MSWARWIQFGLFGAGLPTILISWRLHRGPLPQDYVAPRPGPHVFVPPVPPPTPIQFVTGKVEKVGLDLAAWFHKFLPEKLEWLHSNLLKVEEKYIGPREITIEIARKALSSVIPVVEKMVVQQSFRNGMTLLLAVFGLETAAVCLRTTLRVTSYMAGAGAYLINRVTSESKAREKASTSSYRVREIQNVIFSNSYAKILGALFTILKGLLLTQSAYFFLESFLVATKVVESFDQNMIKRFFFRTIPAVIAGTPQSIARTTHAVWSFPDVFFIYLPVTFAAYNLYLLFMIKSRKAEVIVTNTITINMGGTGEEKKEHKVKIDWGEKMILLGDFTGWSELLRGVHKWSSDATKFGPRFPEFTMKWTEIPREAYSHSTWFLARLLTAPLALVSVVALKPIEITAALLLLPYLGREAVLKRFVTSADFVYGKRGFSLDDGPWFNLAKRFCVWFNWWKTEEMTAKEMMRADIDSSVEMDFKTSEVLGGTEPVGLKAEMERLLHMPIVQVVMGEKKIIATNNKIPMDVKLQDVGQIANFLFKRLKEQAVVDKAMEIGSLQPVLQSLAEWRGEHNVISQLSGEVSGLKVIGRIPGAHRVPYAPSVMNVHARRFIGTYAPHVAEELKERTLITPNAEREQKEMIKYRKKQIVHTGETLTKKHKNHNITLNEFLLEILLRVTGVKNPLSDRIKKFRGLAITEMLNVRDVLEPQNLKKFPGYVPKVLFGLATREDAHEWALLRHILHREKAEKAEGFLGEHLWASIPVPKAGKRKADPSDYRCRAAVTCDQDVQYDWISCLKHWSEHIGTVAGVRDFEPFYGGVNKVLKRMDFSGRSAMTTDTKDHGGSIGDLHYVVIKQYFQTILEDTVHHPCVRFMIDRLFTEMQHAKVLLSAGAGGLVLSTDSGLKDGVYQTGKLGSLATIINVGYAFWWCGHQLSWNEERVAVATHQSNIIEQFMTLIMEIHSDNNLISYPKDMKEMFSYHLWTIPFNHLGMQLKPDECKDSLELTKLQLMGFNTARLKHGDRWHYVMWRETVESWKALTYPKKMIKEDPSEDHIAYLKGVCLAQLLINPFNEENNLLCREYYRHLTMLKPDALTRLDVVQEMFPHWKSIYDTDLMLYQYELPDDSDLFKLHTGMSLGSFSFPFIKMKTTEHLNKMKAVFSRLIEGQIIDPLEVEDLKLVGGAEMSIFEALFYYAKEKLLAMWCTIWSGVCYINPWAPYENQGQFLVSDVEIAQALPGAGVMFETERDTQIVNYCVQVLTAPAVEECVKRVKFKGWPVGLWIVVGYETYAWYSAHGFLTMLFVYGPTAALHYGLYKLPLPLGIIGHTIFNAGVLRTQFAPVHR